MARSYRDREPGLGEFYGRGFTRIVVGFATDAQVELSLLFHPLVHMNQFLIGMVGADLFRRNPQKFKGLKLLPVGDRHDSGRSGFGLEDSFVAMGLLDPWVLLLNVDHVNC